MRNCVGGERGAWLCKVAGILLCVAVLQGAAAGEDWPFYRGPGHDGISNESDWSVDWPEDGLEQLWQASVGTGFSSVVVADGRCYTMGNIEDRDIVYCFDARTGEELWRRHYPCPLDPKLYEGGPNATPGVAEGRVYTLSRKGDLFCFDAETGDEIWYVDLRVRIDAETPKWGFSCSPIIVDGVMCLNVGNRGMAINAATGRTVWESGGTGGSYASAVPFTADGQKGWAVFSNSGLVAVTRDRGRRLWRFKWTTRHDVNAADPIIYGNRAFVSSGYGAGCAMIDFTGGEARELWRNKQMKNHFNCSVLWDGYIYGFDENQLNCLDAESGELRWSQRGMGKGSLMAADGKLIILSEGGELVIAAADSEGFVSLARTQILSGRCWTVPVLSDGRVYARNAVGDLVCLALPGAERDAQPEAQPDAQGEPQASQDNPTSER